MFRRIGLLLLCCTGLLSACECYPPPVPFAYTRASIVFQGTIIRFRDSGKSHKTVVFRVTRVWKGRVNSQVELLALADDINAPCVGVRPYLQQIGNDLLVYAHGKEAPYLTSECMRTQFAKNASGDFERLGPGYPPVRSIR